MTGKWNLRPLSMTEPIWFRRGNKNFNGETTKTRRGKCLESNLRGETNFHGGPSFNLGGAVFQQGRYWGVKSGSFWKRDFPVLLWTGENGTSRKRWPHSIGFLNIRACARFFGGSRESNLLIAFLCGRGYFRECSYCGRGSLFRHIQKMRSRKIPIREDGTYI